MKIAPLPANEEQRLARLRSYRILDTEAEAAFDQLIYLAGQACRAPMALLSLVDDKRQWFKARTGLSAQETPREIAFCSYAILQDGVFTVPDAREDERFRENPLVTGELGLRSYAGVPLVDSQGMALGTVCVLHREPREFSEEEKRSLLAVAQQAILQMELRRLKLDMANAYDHAAGVLAAMNHELRTPLNGILGATELLLDSNLSEEQRQWAALSQRSATAMMTAVEQVLALGREVAESALASSQSKK